MDSTQSVSLSPTQATPQSAISSIPIRAPLSSDSDFFESAVKTHSRSSSSSSISSSLKSFVEDEVEDDGFLSGEDGFESATELAMEVEDDDSLPIVVPIVGKPVLDSSSLSTTPPKARITGEDEDVDDVEDDIVELEGEVVDDEDSTIARVPIVEAPEFEVLGVQGGGGEGKNGISAIAVEDSKKIGHGPVSQNPVLDLGSAELVEDKVPVDGEVGDKVLEAVSKEDVLPEKVIENGVLGSEGEVEESSVSEVVGDGVPAVAEVSNEALVVDKEEFLPDIPKLDVEANPEIGGREKEEVETKDEVVQVKECLEDVGEAVVVKKEEVVPESLKQDVVVTPDNGSGEKEMVETKEEVVQEKEVVDTKDEVFQDKAVDVNDSEALSSTISEDAVVQDEKEVKSTSEGDLLVEPKAIPLEAEYGAVRDVEENVTDVAKPVEAEVDSSASVGVVSEQSPVVNEEPENLKVVEAGIVIAKLDDDTSVVSEQTPVVIEESDGLKAVEGGTDIAKVDTENGELSASEKNLEIVENSAIETQKADHLEPKIEVVEVQKDDDEKSVSFVSKSISLDSDDSKKPELEQTDVEPKSNEPAFRLAIDADENGLDDGEAQSADSGITSEDVKTGQENTLQVTTESSDAVVASQGDELEVVPLAPKTEVAGMVLDSGVKEDDEDEDEDEDEVEHLSYYQEEADGSVSDEDNEELNFGSSATAEQIMKELMRGSGVSFQSDGRSSQDNSERIDGQIVMDSDEEVDTDEEGEGKELFDSAALAALLKAATSAGGPDGGNVTITSQDGSRLFSVERPAGLGSSIRASKPASQPSRPNIFTSSDLAVGGESEVQLSDEEKKKLEKLQLVRVKFLRLIDRLGHSSDDAIAAQVLYRMVLAAGRQTGPAFSLETAKKTAMQLEAEKSEDLDFSLNILVLGKTGVGKSATINSIFGEQKAKIGAFERGTTSVKEIIGTVGGVKIRIIDTPGLKSSVMEQAFNRKVLSSVKKLTKRFPLDILLYVDRLDTQTRDLNDLPLLKTITNTLGSSVWRSAVVTLTHGASAPPDGPSGSPLSYEVFVAQRSHIVQQSIGQAVGDLRMMNPSLMNPVSLVENHPSCRKNREGQRILPNGQIWRPQLLLLCYSLKVLSEVSSLSKPQDPFDHRKLFGFRVRAPPLPYLLSSLLQSRAHPKLPDDQGGDNVDSDIDLEDLSDSDQEDEDDEYDQLPPFKPLRKAQIAKLSKDQKKAYFDEYDYRVKLLQKKQWKEELKRMKEMKKKGKVQTDNVDFMGEDADQEGPAAVPVPLPDMVLPPSFDGDNPAYRYRFLEPTSQLLARPVLDTHGWDHDCGYDGVSLEENLAIAGRFPGGVAVQITKDKKEFNIHLDSSIAAKHGENGSTLAGFDIQTIGKQLGYIVRGETKFKNFKKNKTTGGVSVTFLGENVATGLKVEDQISIGKRLTLVGSTGTIRSQGDAAYGANLEVRLKEKDFPIGQDQSTLGLSLMKWRGDLALGANLQSQIAIGRSSKMSVRVGLNNKLSGQITVKTSSSEQLQLALVGLLPIAISLYRSIWPSAGESFSAY